MATYGQLKTSPYGSNGWRKCCGCSARFIHYFLFIFNFIFLISGVIILLLTLVYGTPLIDVGETHLSDMRSFLPFTHLVNLIHHSMITCGIAICLISLTHAVVSCCVSSHKWFDESVAANDSERGLTSPRSQANSPQVMHSTRLQQRQHLKRMNRNNSRRNPSLIICVYVFALLFLFTLQLIIGIVTFISLTPNSEGKDEFISSFNENLNATQVISSHNELLSSFYQKFRCCGWNDFEDYNALNKSSAVPDSCCKTVISNCGERKHPSNIYYDGCVHKLAPILKEYVLILGSVALGFSIVEVFGLIFSCCLYVQLTAKYT